MLRGEIPCKSDPEYLNVVAPVAAFVAVCLILMRPEFSDQFGDRYLLQPPPAQSSPTSVSPFGPYALNASKAIKLSSWFSFMDLCAVSASDD